MLHWASLVVQLVKNPPAVWETWVWSLGWEEPLDKGMATHSSVLAWRILMDKGAWLATVHGVTKSRTLEWLRTIGLCLLTKHDEVKWKWKLLSHVWLFATPWTTARQAPLSLGILQERILEWVAISFSRGSSQPRDQTQVSHIAGGFFSSWATREAHVGSKNKING